MNYECMNIYCDKDADYLIDTDIGGTMLCSKHLGEVELKILEIHILGEISDEHSE